MLSNFLQSYSVSFSCFLLKAILNHLHLNPISGFPFRELEIRKLISLFKSNGRDLTFFLTPTKSDSTLITLLLLFPFYIEENNQNPNPILYLTFDLLKNNLQHINFAEFYYVKHMSISFVIMVPNLLRKAKRKQLSSAAMIKRFKRHIWESDHQDFNPGSVIYYLDCKQVNELLSTLVPTCVK